MRKISLVMLIFFIVSLSACSNQSAELKSLKAENERLKSELSEKESPKNKESTNQSASTTKNKPVVTQSSPSPPSSVNKPTIVQSNPSISSYDSKRTEFADYIKKALNAPGLPEMCTDAYFNNKGELIIEVNGEWLILDDELKKDMIYSLENALRSNKDSLNVEGFGQFFSDSGRPLESFYAD